MHVTRVGKDTFYESRHVHIDEFSAQQLKRYAQGILELFARRPLFRELLNAWGKRKDLEGRILLHAHGTHAREWRYHDGYRTRSIQDWVGQYDGRAAGLLLLVCNHHGNEVHSEESPVIHPRSPLRIADLGSAGYLRLYVPHEGYLEDNRYKLRRAIERLRSRRTYHNHT